MEQTEYGTTQKKYIYLFSSVCSLASVFNLSFIVFVIRFACVCEEAGALYAGDADETGFGVDSEFVP